MVMKSAVQVLNEMTGNVNKSIQEIINLYYGNNQYQYTEQEAVARARGISPYSKTFYQMIYDKAAPLLGFADASSNHSLDEVFYLIQANGITLDQVLKNTTSNSGQSMGLLLVITYP